MKAQDYSRQADILEEKAARMADPWLASRMRKVAAGWRRLAREAERPFRGPLPPDPPAG